MKFYFNLGSYFVPAFSGDSSLNVLIKFFLI